jgi:hypothetical protein
MIRAVLTAFARAVLSQLHPRMLMLTILPFILSLLLWGLVLMAGLDPLMEWLRIWLSEREGFRIAGSLLGSAGMEAVRIMLAPLLAMWVLLPLMILTALLFVGAFALPAIARHVGDRHYPGLERRKGGSLWGSVGLSMGAFAVFLVLWLLTLPLHLIPPLGVLTQPLLWGWLTYRVMAYDALAEHASDAERRDILKDHRWPLLIIGCVGGLLGAAPTLFWLGGAFWLFLLPLMAGVSIWLYVLVFVFTGLWFEHYCLAVLNRLRARPAAPAAAALPGA